MRVAVCLSGEMRGCPDCLDNLKTHVIQPFEKVEAEVDLLVCTRADRWWSDVWVYLSESIRMLHVEHNAPMDSVKYIEGPVNPQHLGRAEGTDRRSFFYQSYLQYFRSLKTVGEMLARAEEQDDVPYDWVVRARPDAKLRDPLKVENLEPGVVHFPHNDWWPYTDTDGQRLDTLCDKFAVGPSRSMHVYFSRLDFLRRYCDRYILHAELLVRWQMDEAKIAWKKSDDICVLRGKESDLYACSVPPNVKE